MSSRRSGSSTGCWLIALILVAISAVFAWMYYDSLPDPEPVVEAPPPPPTDPHDGLDPLAGNFPVTLDEAESAAAPARTGSAPARTSSSGSSSTSSRNRYPSLSSWQSGASGYERVIEEHTRRNNAPLAVFFYTEWCGYCRHMNAELLSSSEVTDYFGTIRKVRINPDDGEREKAIANEWNVKGYPSFFMLAPGSTSRRKIHPYSSVNGEQTVMSPESFVQSCKNAVGD